MPLQPFLKNSVSDITDPTDIEDGIYNFLSPSILPPDSSKSRALQNQQLSTPAAGSSSSTAEDIANESASNNTIEVVTKQDFRRIKPPKWYVKGQNVDVLLKDAENLDWTQDAVTPYPSSNNGTVNSNTNTSLVPGAGGSGVNGILNASNSFGTGSSLCSTSLALINQTKDKSTTDMILSTASTSR